MKIAIAHGPDETTDAPRRGQKKTDVQEIAAIKGYSLLIRVDGLRAGQ